jgi:hypothetical protein
MLFILAESQTPTAEFFMNPVYAYVKAGPEAYSNLLVRANGEKHPITIGEFLRRAQDTTTFAGWSAHQVLLELKKLMAQKHFAGSLLEFIWTYFRYSKKIGHDRLDVIVKAGVERFDQNGKSYLQKTKTLFDTDELELGDNYRIRNH